MGFFQYHPKYLLGLVYPGLFIVGAVILTFFITDNPELAAGMARGIAGPTTWPKYMLYGVMFFAAGWLLQDLRLTLREYRIHSKYPIRPAHPEATQAKEVAPSKQSAGERSSEGKIWLGMALILAYGFFIHIVGFPIATVIYLVAWFVLGGIRKPIQISLVGVLGTIVLLYIFVKLALMPLDRGQGVFNDWTLAIYRLLKIF